MNSKLNCILLVDDNSADNFFHERVIKKTEYANAVIAKQSAPKALDYIKTKHEHPDKHPDLIFLDINMPGMNGWEFLIEYDKLPDELKTKVIVVMLTTSANPDDIEKAKAISSVTDFKTKPLTEEMLEDIMKRYF